MATVTPLRRIEFASSDPLEIRDFLHRVRGSRIVLNGTRDRGWRVALTQVDAGEFSSSQMRLPADIAFRMHGRDEVVIHTILGGTVGLDHGQASHRYRLGDVYVASCPRVDFTCHTHEVRSQTITLRQSLLTEVARVTPDPPGGPWEFLPFASVTASGARQWREAARYVDGLLSDPAAAATPLVLSSAARLLAATALTVFPNTAVTEPAARDRTDAHPATLHRAVSFIEANADVGITITDIARAVGVTTRAIQLAFRRHLDTTPGAYLRRVRLERVRAELLAAGPGGGQTVTAIAARWGFCQPQPLHRILRQAYGITPGRTLRHGQPQPLRISPPALSAVSSLIPNGAG
jgi:AraC-like DNA-binding protein